MSSVRLGVRVAITIFIAVLLAVVAMGWIWTGEHQPPALKTASHAVLAVSGLAGVLALTRIWRRDPPRTDARR